MRLSHLIIVGLSLGHRAGAVCSVDEDCNLNGVCDQDTSMCACAAAWTGNSCGMLDLELARPSPGAGFDESGNSSWGGSRIILATFTAKAKVTSSFDGRRPLQARSSRIQTRTSTTCTSAELLDTVA